MPNPWSALAWLIVTLLLLIVLSRWATRELGKLGYLLSGDGVATALLTFAILLPGIFLHELSHWLMAKALGLRTGKFRLWPEQRKKSLRLGYVEVEGGGMVRDSLVGLAPFLVGSGVLLYVGYRVFDLGGTGSVWQAGQTVQGLAHFLSGFDAPDAWLWLYLAFAVSNAMMPSESDRQPWASLFLFLGILVGAALFFGVIPTLSPETTVWLARSFTTLTYTFAFAVVVDLVFGLVIVGVQGAIYWLAGGQRV
ncbi:MAG: hypothetical protein IT330_11095 [Anaerolineae bacterium]|nr:hypothetical protein [Anaerolineae bacterium]